MAVIVYTLPSCVQCMMTERMLKSNGINYSLRDLRDLSVLQEVEHLGYKQAPIVVTGTDSWSGFRPDRIGEIV